MLHYPGFDPIAFEIGPLFGYGPIRVHWYGIMYLLGFAGAWWLARLRARRADSTWKANDVDDLIFYCMLGVIAGGRTGYVLFYGLSFWAKDPWYFFKIWEGGMSFHGGLLGMIAAMALFARRHKLRFFHLTDPVAAATPIGLFLGRLANFINGELYGRPTDVPWAMVFPRDEAQLPRHPSQLYEAGLEGILLFIFLFVAVRRFHVLRQPGMESGLFLIGYGVCRIIAEYFRQPDIQLGYLIGGTTMGQILSLPMIAFGIAFIWRARRAP
jgi:phosphatidylglycerol---prolipoprotein diacylglyceryl transferase